MLKERFYEDSCMVRYSVWYKSWAVEKTFAQTECRGFEYVEIDEWVYPNKILTKVNVFLES